MKKLNKIFALILALSVVLAICVLTTSCDTGDSGSECTSHTDTDKNGKCDICSANVEIPECETHTDSNGDRICDVCKRLIKNTAQKVQFEITVKSEDGVGVKNAKVMLMSDETVVVTAYTNENGVATGEVTTGEYLVAIEELPENWYTVGNYTRVEITTNKKSFTYEAVDNTPDGSNEKPFPSENAETGETAEVTFPAGTEYVFTTKGASRYLVIRNASAIVTYKETEYTPDEDGVVKVLIKSTESNEVAFFKIKNTSEAEAVIKLEFETIPGTAENPFNAELDTAYTPMISIGGTTYYKWVATESGILIVTSSNVQNNIAFFNRTTYETTNATNGTKCQYIAVSEGDVVEISVSTVSAEVATEIEFILSLHQGTEDDPLPIYEEKRLTIAGEKTLYFVYHGDAKNVVITDTSLAVSLNGTEQSADGYYYFAVEENDVITITNTQSGTVDFVLSIASSDEE